MTAFSQLEKFHENPLQASGVVFVNLFPVGHTAHKHTCWPCDVATAFSDDAQLHSFGLDHLLVDLLDPGAHGLRYPYVSYV